MAVVKIIYPEAMRLWENAAQEFRSGLMERIRTYAVYLVQYIKREKLSGQVLGKYQRAYDAVGGQKRWRKQPGTLKKTFAMNVYNDPAIQFYETVYGRAWEGGPNGEGWTRKAYTVRPLAWRNPKTARLMFYVGGAWRFAKKVHIPAMSFPAKPHIRPSILETADRFKTLIWRPWQNYMRGRS